MTDPMDRYVRRELTAAEGRDLAQKSLDDPELFEDLTASALAAAALASPPKVVRFPRKTRFIAAGVAAAAAIVAVLLYSLRPSQQPALPQIAASSRLKPSLAWSADHRFFWRAGSRLRRAAIMPRSSGARRRRAVLPGPPVRSSPVEDGLAAIDLGSLDGLGKDSQLEVFRGEKSVGHLAVTAVFRDRARARILDGARILVKDQVRAPAAVYLDALLQQVEALSGRDPVAARATAEKAGAFAETAKVPPVELERLAGLEYQLGLLQAAEKHYQSAEPLASFGALNNLAVLRILHGDYNGAEAPLNRVVSTAPKTDTEYARSVNNLGVLAELHGDRQNAEQLYTEALALSAGSPDRRALEANLARIRGQH